MTEAGEASLAARPGGIIQQRAHPIEAWLDSLPERKRSAVLAYTATERSPVLSFLYASLLGHQGSPDDWEAWIRRRWDKLDTRLLLENEVVALQQDIAHLRQLVEEGKARAGDMSNRIAFLSRELRGHKDSLDKEQSVHDRRALLLAGVEIASKMLRKVYGRDGAIWPVIEACLEGAWADIEERHSLK